MIVSDRRAEIAVIYDAADCVTLGARGRVYMALASNERSPMVTRTAKAPPKLVIECRRLI